MADLAAIREALADALNTLPDVVGHSHKPDLIQTPCAIVEPRNVDWDTAFGRGHEGWTFNIKVLVSLASNTAGQQQLDTFFGGISDVKDAIEHHAPLNDGTAADDATVHNAQGFDGWQVDNQVYLGVDIVVEVIA